MKEEEEIKMKVLKKIKKHLSVMMAVCMMFTMSMPAFAAEKVTINQSKATVNVGETVQLSVDNTTRKPVWYSSNINIAEVDDTGLVTTLNKGSVTITGRIGTKKYSSKITVKAPTIKLNKSAATIFEKLDKQLGD